MNQKSIDAFKATIVKHGGLARTNRFNVLISLPVGLAADQGRDLSLLCETAILPGKQITSMEWAMFGHTVKVPTNFIQEDVTCTFNVTNDYYVKHIFDLWQHRVIDGVTFNLNYDSHFKTDILIQQLDEADVVVYETKLHGAYPISVQPITLDNNAELQTQKLSVTFSYANYTQKVKGDTINKSDNAVASFTKTIGNLFKL